MLSAKDIYRQLFDLLPDPLVVVRDGQVVLGNQIFYAKYGYSPEDLEAGLQFLELVHEDYRDVAQKKYTDRMKGLPVDTTLRIDCVSKDGSVIPCETSAILQTIMGEKTILASVRDITERVHLDRKLSNLHDQLNATLNALPDIMFETDVDGVILDYRAPHPERLYLKPELFLNKRMTDILPELPAQAFLKSMQLVKKFGRSSGRMYPLEIGGEEKWFEVSAAAKGDLDTPEGRIVFLVRDITDRRMAEEHLAGAKYDLEKQGRDLQEKNAAISQILNYIKDEKTKYRESILSDLLGVIEPILSELKKELGPTQQQKVRDIESTVNLLLKGDNSDLNLRMSKLTARESEICGLIKNGLSTKQIAEQLNLSEKTIHKHREHVRTTLGLVGKSLSLATVLRMYHLGDER
jgi:PAS domain S-box-containing protein